MCFRPALWLVKFVISVLAVSLASCEVEDSTMDEPRSFNESEPSWEAYIARVVREQDSSFVIINEDHGIPAHRYVSACLFAEISRDHDQIVLAAETFSGQGVIASDPISGGYVWHPGFNEIIGAGRSADAIFFAYDPVHDERLSDEELHQRGVATVYYNRRDRLAAERLLSAAELGLVFVHVGHGHVSEQTDRIRHDGQLTAWLAGHLADMLSADQVLTIDQDFPRQLLERRSSLCPRFTFPDNEMSVVLDTMNDSFWCVEKAAIGRFRTLADIYLLGSDNHDSIWPCTRQSE